MAAMRRALLRTGIRLKYSEGFNPHPHISVALPLPIGCGSACELLDFKTQDALMPDGLADMINASMPEGMEILEAYVSQRKFSSIAWVELRAVMHYGSEVPQQADKMIESCYSSESIVITKKTKRGITDIDIAPHIRYMCVNLIDKNTMSMTIKASAQNPTINPENLLAALTGEHAATRPDFARFTRVETFDNNLNVFR